MSRNKRGNNNSQQFSGQNRKERRANAAKKARNESSRNGGGKRNKQSVSNDRWACKNQNGRQVRDEDHSYVAEAVEPMNQVQSEFLNDMREKALAVFMAPAGAGKSFIAASEACDWLKSGDFDKIYLTRPNVGMGKSLGSLKGDLRAKFEPLLLPLIDVIKERYGAGFYESALNNGTIEFVPMEYIRGRSIKDVVIVDEAQNTTPDEMYTLLTRIADGGILIAIGDPTQNDLRGETGIEWLVDFVDRHEDLQEFVGVTEATSDDIVRGGLCKMTVKAREKDIANGK